VGKKNTLRFATVGALCLHSVPVPAQDVSGVQQIFGIEQGLEYGRNTSLSVPADGDRLAATSTLSYGIVTETRTQRLSFDIQGTYLIESEAGDTGGAIDGPVLTLSYSREAANASLDVSAEYRTEQIESLRSLTDFLGEDGVLDAPDDFTDLTGTGRRTRYSADATLVLGREDPLGFQFDLRTSGTTYQDETDPDLTDETEVGVGAATRLRISPVLTGTVGLSYAVTEEEDAAQTRRTVSDLDFGVIYDISERATLEATIGSSRTRTETTTDDTETTGLTGRLALGYDMSNGDISASLDASRDVEGDQVLTLLVSRDLALPAGSLSASIGATSQENDDVSLIGSLDWRQELPTSSLLLRLDRSVTVDSDADTRRRTLAGAYYTYDINTFSGLTLGATYVVSEASSATNEVTRSDITATYSYALTRDWDLNTAVGYTVRDEDTVGRATSPLVAVSIAREFTARR
jgi:predicted porin